MSRTATVVLVPGVLTAAVKAVHEQLASYGHQMDWSAGGRRADGTCSACRGRVQVSLGSNGAPSAAADPTMIASGSGPADYAECPSIPRLARFSPRRRVRT